MGIWSYIVYKWWLVDRVDAPFFLRWISPGRYKHVGFNWLHEAWVFVLLFWWCGDAMSDHLILDLVQAEICSTTTFVYLRSTPQQQVFPSNVLAINPFQTAPAKNHLPLYRESWLDEYFLAIQSCGDGKSQTYRFPSKVRDLTRDFLIFHGLFGTTGFSNGGFLVVCYHEEWDVHAPVKLVQRGRAQTLCPRPRRRHPRDKNCDFWVRNQSGKIGMQP